MRRNVWKSVTAAALSAVLVMSNAGIASFAAQSVSGGKWKVEGGSRYYKTGLGEKLTGLYEIDGKLYAFEDDGALIRPERQNPYAAGQFVEIAGKTYFVYFNGEVEQNKPLWLFGQDEQDGEAYWYYYLNEEDGYCKGSSKGIGNKNKKLYMFDDQGHMISGERKEYDGQYIYLTCAADGSAAVNKWIHLDDGWHWFNEDINGFSMGEVTGTSEDYIFDDNGILTSGNAPYGEVQSVTLGTGEENEIALEVGKEYKLPISFITDIPGDDMIDPVNERSQVDFYKAPLPDLEQNENKQEEVVEDVSQSNPSLDESGPDNPTVDESEQDNPTVDESEQDNPTVDEPEQDNPSVDEPEQGNPPVDESEESNPPVDEPEESNPPVDEPEENNPPVDEPEENNPPVDEPEQGNPPVDEPEEGNPPVDEPEQDNEPEEKSGDYKKSDSPKTNATMFSLFNVEIEDSFTTFDIGESGGSQSADEVVNEGGKVNEVLNKAYDFGLFTENVSDDDPYFRFASEVGEGGKISIKSNVPGKAVVWASIDGVKSNEITFIFKAPNSKANATKALEGLTDQPPQIALAQIMQMDKTALMTALPSKETDYRQIDQNYMFENNIEQIVETDSEISEQFDGNKLDIVGAALNAGGSEIVKFKMSKASEAADLTAINKKTKVSVDLDLSCDGTPITDLEVPVLVTLPIPSNMSTSDLSLYHLHDGQLKQMDISVNSSDRTISFATDGFSTFVFAAGDTSSDGGSGSHSGGSSGGGGGSSSGSKSKAQDSAGEAGTWVQDETGWWFKKLNGSYPVSTWLMTGNEWYRFDDKGYMMTGWYTDENGKKYYLNPVSDGSRGAMKTGWQIIDEKWYYFSTVSDGFKGSLQVNTTTPDGYKVGADGVWIQ